MLGEGFQVPLNNRLIVIQKVRIIEDLGMKNLKDFWEFLCHLPSKKKESKKRA
ncbi:MAG: hypothetical protein ACPK85_01505 [Methanosarcina sp.]